MIDKKIIAWFSCGITSAIACKMAVDKYGKENVMLVYFEIDSAHEDNERFIKECEEWIGVKVERRRSSKYKDQFEVIQKTRYVNGPSGARCTKELKKDVRVAVESEVNFEHQVFGFEYDKKEINRAIRFAQQYPHTNPIFPLIEAKLTKEICAGMLINAGIEIPTMYKLGFHNNNCFIGETKFITDNGVKTFSETVGTSVNILNRSGWQKANIYSFGQQPIWELIVKNGYRLKTILTTKEHRWIVPKYKNRSQGLVELPTNLLPIGKNILINYCTPTITPDVVGIQHGFVFGDGSLYYSNNDMSKNKFSRANFCGEKLNDMLKFFPNHKMQPSDNSINSLPAYFKTLPNKKESKEYLLGFICGLIASDGCVSHSGITITNNSKETIEYIIDIIKSLGILCWYNGEKIRSTNYLKDATTSTIIIPKDSFNIDWLLRNFHKQNFGTKRTFAKSWSVVSVRETSNIEEVFCCTVDGVSEFTLDDNILTGNCRACVKGGMGYFNLIRKNFPEDFDKMAKLEREVGRSCIKNKFLDELKETDGRHEPPILPDCGTFCEIEFSEIEDPNTSKIISGEISIDSAVNGDYPVT